MNVCPKAYTISDVDSMQAAITPPLHLAPLHLAPVGTKAVDLDFDGGRLSSDAGLVLLKERVLQIAAGYEDANDANTLRHDPIFKLLLDRLPETGAPLASQPTIS